MVAGAVNGPVLLVGTRKGAWLLRADAARRDWTASDPMFLGQIVQHMVLDPRDRRTLLLGSRRGTRADGLAISDLGRTWQEASRPPAFRANDPLGRALRAVFWLAPGHADERASGTRAGRRRASSGPRTAVTRGTRSRVGTTTRIGSAGRSGPRRAHPMARCCTRSASTRDAAHLYIGLSGGGVFETSTAARTGSRSTPDRSRRSSRIRSRSTGTIRIAYGCTRCGLIGCTSRTTAASTAWSARTVAGSASATTCRAMSATSASQSNCILATPTRHGCSPWTAPTCGHARVRTAGLRCS